MAENLKIIAKLLEDFSNFVEDRSTTFLVIFDEFFPKILEWHFAVWKKEYGLLSKDKDLKEWSNYSEISRTLDNIFKKIEERTLKDGHSYSFFRAFKKHLEKYKEEFVEGSGDKKFYYVESVVSIFFSTFTESIKTSPEKHDIWEDYFPREWKITKDNIVNKDNMVSRVMLNNFFEWAHQRFWKSEEKQKYDEVLDEIASNLFPSVEPILWAKLLTVVIRPWTDDNRMKFLVEEGPNFGFISRIFTGFNDSEDILMDKWHDQMSSQEKTTIELALFLFNQQFTKENVGQFIADLNGLQYDKESKEEVRRKHYIEIFEKILNILEPKKS